MHISAGKTVAKTLQVRFSKYLWAVLTALVILVGELWRLGAANPWWDEGWTLMVARTWVERGFYGRLLNGELAPPGLEAAFPTTRLVALSFRWFGVGLWQGRLPIAICMLVALVLLLWLVTQLYSRPVAQVMLVLLLLTPMHRQLHPLLVGRQVLAEPVMMLCIMAGYCCLWVAFKRSYWFILGTSFAWGVALCTKAQLLPFWAVAIASMGVAGLLYRRKDYFALAIASGIGSLICWQLLIWLQSWFLVGHTLPKAQLTDLYYVTAFVFVPQVRVNTLYRVALFALPTIAGLAWAIRVILRERTHHQHIIFVHVIEWSLIALTGSWLAWYALLSSGDERYLFPAFFLGSMFVAHMFVQWYSGANLAGIIDSAAGVFIGKGFSRFALRSIALTCFAAMTVPVTMITIYKEVTYQFNTSAVEVADFFNRQPEKEGLIETYNSEIMFFLDRPYHFPPDQTHIELIKRIFGGDFEQPIDYKPLAYNPEYIIVGGLPADWGIYSSVIPGPAFYLYKTIGIYSIYKRASSL